MPKSVAFRWTGEAMVPLLRQVQAFVVGKVYRLKEEQERSEESHGHYFLLINRAFDNLPERYADVFASADHLRKWCLIKAGYRTDRTFVMPSPEHALALLAFIQPLDPYAVIVPDGNLVSVYTARTQKLLRSGNDGMDKAEFEASKEAVLRECSRLLGVDVVTLSAQEAPSLAPAHSDEHQTEPVG